MAIDFLNRLEWTNSVRKCSIIKLHLLLPLALQPTVGFGLSNNVLPFFPICHQLSPLPHSQHLKISFYFLFPSFPGSSPSSRHVARAISVYLVFFRPSSFNLSSFFLRSTFVTVSFLLGGVVRPMPNPQPGGPGYPFLSGSSPLTCLAFFFYYFNWACSITFAILHAITYVQYYYIH